MRGITAERLPHGRHGLTREEVEDSQRSRMLRAMAEAVAENGYASTPVSEVLKRARVSRETFYEHFANKEECFLASYDAAAALVLAAMGGGATPSGGAALLDHVLERYLGTLAAEPAVARTFLIEVYAAGDAALARRVEVQRRFVDQVVTWTNARSEEQRFTCEMVVAAVIGLVTNWISAGRTERLPELHQPLMRQIESMLTASGLDTSS